MFESLCTELVQKIISYINRTDITNASSASKKWHYLIVEATREEEFQIFINYIRDTKKQLISTDHRDRVNELSFIEEQAQNYKRSNIDTLSDVRKLVDRLKIQLRDVLFKIKVEDLEQIRIINPPVGFRYFFNRLLCDKRIASSTTSNNNDYLILNMIDFCLKNEDLAKAKELANRMQNKELSNINVLLFSAKTNPQEAFTKIEMMADTDRKTSIFSSLIRICEENNHIDMLTEFCERFFSALSGRHYGFITKQYDNNGETQEREIELYLTAIMPLVRCHIKKEDISASLEIVKKLEKCMFGIRHEADPYGTGYYKRHNEKMSKRRETFAATISQILYQVGSYFIKKGNWAKVIEISKQMNPPYQGENLLAEILHTPQASSLSNEWILSNIACQITHNKGSRQNAYLYVVKKAIAQNDIVEAERVAGLFPTDGDYQSLAFELLVNHALENKNTRQAFDYLDKISNAKIRQKILKEIDSTQTCKPQFLI